MCQSLGSDPKVLCPRPPQPQQRFLKRGPEARPRALHFLRRPERLLFWLKVLKRQAELGRGQPAVRGSVYVLLCLCRVCLQGRHVCTCVSACQRVCVLVLRGGEVKKKSFDEMVGGEMDMACPLLRMVRCHGSKLTGQFSQPSPSFRSSSTMIRELSCSLPPTPNLRVMWHCVFFIKLKKEIKAQTTRFRITGPNF